MDTSKIEEILSDFLEELRKIFFSVKKEASKKSSLLDRKVFFDLIRDSVFDGKLKASQVKGIESKLDIFVEQSFPLSWAAYVLATSFHETAQRMLPVREGLNASDGWRKRNLRYYPWYGRGDVQLTWEDNYRRADKELGLNGELVSNPDLALDPVISAKVITTGMKEGWFSKGNSMERLLPKDGPATLRQFTKARPIVNIMDKASLIAGYAVKFQSALKEAGY